MGILKNLSKLEGITGKSENFLLTNELAYAILFTRLAITNL